MGITRPHCLRPSFLVEIAGIRLVAQPRHPVKNLVLPADIKPSGSQTPREYLRSAGRRVLQPDHDRTTDRSDSASQEAAPAVDCAAGDRVGLPRRDHGALPAGVILRPRLGGAEQAESWRSRAGYRVVAKASKLSWRSRAGYRVLALPRELASVLAEPSD